MKKKGNARGKSTFRNLIIDKLGITINIEFDMLKHIVKRAETFRLKPQLLERMPSIK